MVGDGGSVRCSRESGAIPLGGDLGGGRGEGIFKQVNNEFGLKLRAFEICQGQLSGHAQEAAESQFRAQQNGWDWKSLNQGLSG